MQIRVSSSPLIKIVFFVLPFSYPCYFIYEFCEAHFVGHKPTLIEEELVELILFWVRDLEFAILRFLGEAWEMDNKDYRYEDPHRTLM